MRSTTRSSLDCALPRAAITSWRPVRISRAEEVAALSGMAERYQMGRPRANRLVDRGLSRGLALPAPLLDVDRFGRAARFGGEQAEAQCIFEMRNTLVLRGGAIGGGQLSLAAVGVNGGFGLHRDNLPSRP